jgi:hypothetical protein
MKLLVTSLGLLAMLMFMVIPAKSDTQLNSPASEVLGVSHGAHLRPSLEYGQEILDFNQLSGKDIAVLMYFTSWSSYDAETGEFFNYYLLRKMGQKFGEDLPVIMLTWVPVDGRKTLAGKPACDKDYSGAIPLDTIISGKCDDYITGFAKALKARPERFLLRFAHEMNIADSSWWPGHFGQKADKYVQMWRHVFDVFNSVQVSNVEWVWSPNYASHPDKSWNDLNNYYPGDNYLDWIGLSGYNWASSRNAAWDSFDYLYDDVLHELACNYPKPQIIAEVGSVEGGGSKTDWITDAYQKIPQYPFLRMVVWFNDYAYEDSSEADFRVTTGTTDFGDVQPLPLGSGSWTNAFQQAVSNPVYRSDVPSLISVSPPRVYCGENSPLYEVQPTSMFIEPGESSLHVLSGLLFSSNQGVSLDVGSNPYFKDSTVSPDTLLAPWSEVEIHIRSNESTPLGNYKIFINVGSQKIPIDIEVVSFVGRQYLPVIQ